MRRLLFAGGAVAGAFLLQTIPAFACGGLVAPDGDVRLDKATTFVAWHDGVEHYVTSFAYQGSAVDLGWIVPLPTVPESIQAAGKWTLQRLEREFRPPIVFADGFAAPQAAAAKSIVVQQLQVEALDVTVLKGTGQAVVDWCIHNGFLLPAETKAHLLQYAKGSPVFMAAKYNTSVALQRHQVAGDGVPLLITMRTPQLWVPLEVLANDDTPVNADIFLLTDNPLRPVGAPLFLDATFGVLSVDGAPGFVIAKQEPMNPTLHHDLSSDRNMGWVPADGFVSYLTLNASSSDVTYDLGVGSDNVIRLASYGTAPARAAAPPTAKPLPAMVFAAGVLVVAIAGIATMRGLRRNRWSASR